ncbi:hypothetical protein [Geotalea toluenoxydans]
MDKLGCKNTPLELIQIILFDSLHPLWHLPGDYQGEIVLDIYNGKIHKSVPPVKGDKLVNKAYALPLVHALTGFDGNFVGGIKITIAPAGMIDVTFHNKDQGGSFLDWYPQWETAEKERLHNQGMANRLRSKMHKQMSIEEILDRRIGSIHMLPSEQAIVTAAFRDITGENGFTGKVIIKYRNRGIRHIKIKKHGESSFTPPSVNVNRKMIAQVLKTILPKEGEGEIEYNLNRGLLNQ